MVYLVTSEQRPDKGSNDEIVAKLASNQGTYFSFMVFGDNHAGLVFNDSSTMKLMWHMNREDRFRKSPIDFIMNVGDVTWDGKDRHFKAYKKIQGLFKWPVLSAIGNHDDPELFEKYCGEAEFSFSDRNAFFITVNNESGELTEEQFKWFTAKLEEGKKFTHTFVFIHKPPFDPYQQEWYNMDNMPWAYRFRKLCAEYKVRMVFSGHKHMFKSETFDGVEYVVTGGGGMLLEIPERDGGYLNYVKVLVNNDYVSYEVRRVSPPLWEYFTYYFWKEAVYWVRNWYGSGYIWGVNDKILEPRVTALNNREYWLFSKDTD
jgi:3',5'-cyclic AMP phosphodiesterase CpdA